MTDSEETKRQTVTIVPSPAQNLAHPQLASGTKVLLSDGSELARVTSITLKAEAGGLWEADITVLPSLPESITADARVIEVTSIDDEVRRYARVDEIESVHTQLLAEQRKTNQLLLMLIDAMGDEEDPDAEPATYMDGSRIT